MDACYLLENRDIYNFIYIKFQYVVFSFAVSIDIIGFPQHCTMNGVHCLVNILVYGS